MKKRIIMLLCTAVLALGFTMAPAMASGGPFYPIKVDEYTYGPLDELRISKVYQLSLSDDPSGIPTRNISTSITCGSTSGTNPSPGSWRDSPGCPCSGS